jgi:hypothetical protein
MTFDNYGEWELDHIYPISKFNLDDINEVKKCFNYKNIQPLWKLENIKKSNKIINERSSCERSERCVATGVLQSNSSLIIKNNTCSTIFNLKYVI